MTVIPYRDKWVSAMTDRDRFNKLMHYEPVDRCFNMEFGYWNENFKLWPMFVENNITTNEEADLFFSFDVINIWYTDCDGDLRPILPYLLEGGINCLFPFEVNSCAHPTELLNEYGKELRIMGGVDKIKLGEDPAAIRAYLEILVPLVERGGHIPFCDHRCPPNVKPEDYLYYLDLKKEMFGCTDQRAVLTRG